MNLLKKHINELSCAVSPSGYESDVMTVWKKLITPYVNKITNCILGDMVAEKKGNGNKTLLLSAHADEIGIIITKIDKEAKIAYFDEIGGIDTNLLIGRKIKIYNNQNSEIYGVIGCQPIHSQKSDKDRNINIRPEDLFIDFGDSIDLLNVGNYGVIDPVFVENGDFISGKAMDNRIGMAIMVEVARRLKDTSLNGTLLFVASTMEEIGARGIRPVINRYKPTQCIIIDVAIATDTPFHTKSNSSSIKLGEGTVITVGPNLDKKITADFQEIANKTGIPYQIDVCAHPTSTDANPVQIMNQGVPTGLISIPCRYMHSPVETINLKDVCQSIELLLNYIINFLN